MNNITYLFGAGASYNACPILNEMGDKMMDLSKVFTKNFYYSDQEKRQNRSKFDELIWLIGKVGKESNEFNTIDTYAKKLYLLDKTDELNEVKLAVSLFFSLWTLSGSNKWKDLKTKEGIPRNHSIDPRYISLLATYLEKGVHSPKINEKVKFVTWNYDLQIEEAYKRFTNNENYGFKEINESFPFIPSELTKSKLVVCHLNGFHGYYEAGKIVDLNSKAKKRDLFNLIETFLFVLDSNDNERLTFQNFINYAWEKESNFAKIARERAVEIFSDTNTLVVIGYSFPPFNHEIDKELFVASKNSLNRLIIQDPNVDEEYVKETFGLTSKVKVTVVKDVKQFVIPNYVEKLKKEVTFY